MVEAPQSETCLQAVLWPLIGWTGWTGALTRHMGHAHGPLAGWRQHQGLHLVTVLWLPCAREK